MTVTRGAAGQTGDNNNNAIDSNGNNGSATSSATQAYPPVVTSCAANPLLNLTVDLGGVVNDASIDVEAYLAIPGVRDLLGDTEADRLLSLHLDSLLNLDLNLDVGGGGSDSQPVTVSSQYRVKCDRSFANLAGGTATTAASASECLQQCEAAAIVATAQLLGLRDCLGATFGGNDGLTVHNCLYFLGSDSDILDVELAIDSVTSDSFCKGC